MMEDRRRTLALSSLALFCALATIAYGPGIRTDLRIPTGHFLPILFNADSLKGDARVALDLLGPKATILLATNALIRQPLDQESLALLCIALQRNKAAPADLARGLALLPRLGWRNNDAMFLLYREAVNRRPADNSTALRYADALLRREQNVDEVFALLTAMEQYPAGRSALIGTLAKKPNWRLSYLAATARLAPEAIEARLETVKALSASAAPLDARELAVLINGLVARGAPDRAHALWLAARGGAGRPAEAPWDGTFRQAAVAGSRPSWLSVPFEWHFGRGATFAVERGTPADPGVTIDWTGRGTPIFAWQQVRPIGRYQRVSVEMSGPASALPMIDVRLHCPDDAELVFDMRRAGRAVLTSDPVDISRLRCPFPRLDIRGMPAEIARPVRFSIKSVRLAPVAGPGQAL